ncbi:MAG: heme-binding protein [Burkholderiales bacterium]
MKKTLVSLSLATLFAAGAAGAVEMRPVLTLEMAQKMSAACEEKARQEGWKMNIAIMDNGGNLKHFARMDDSYQKSIEIALMKAETSAGFPFSTKQVEGIVKERVPGLAFVPGVATFEGGLPIVTGSGHHIGSIGVSGASAAQDGVCAQAAIDAVKSDLK